MVAARRIEQSDTLDGLGRIRVKKEEYEKEISEIHASLAYYNFTVPASLFALKYPQEVGAGELDELRSSPRASTQVLHTSL